MYDVYIKNYKSGNSIVTTETKIFGVPLNDDTIGFPVSRPNVKGSEDNADSFDFSMENTSPYYDSFLELKTLLRVEYDGDTIFDGRVLTIDGSTIYQTKTVHCEGSFGYMNDSQYEGIQEKRKSKITWSEYYNRLINNHNTMVGTDNPEKVITRGTVTIDGSTTFTPTTETRQYEPSSWTKTSSLISSLVSEFGGHIRTRYQNGTRYLDWYKYYARDLGVNRPTVEVGVNIVDLSTSDSNIDNLFTYCIPIGASNSNGEPVYVDGYVYTDKNGNQHTHSGKAVPVSIIRDLYTDSQLNDDFHNASDYSSAKANYGSIYRPENFGGAKTKEQLWNFMKEWMKNCYFGLATSFTVRGYDIHITDPTKAKILVGDCVNVKYYIVENGVKTFVTKRLVCKAVTYDLFNPENNSYTFGIPGEILKHTYSEGRKSASEQLTGGGGGGGDGDDKQYELTFLDIARKIQDAAGESDVYGGNAAMDSFLANGQCSGSVWLYDPAELPSDEDPPNPRAHPEIAFQANIVGKLTHRGATKWIAISDRMLCAFMNVRPDRDEAQPVSFIYERYSKSHKYPGYNSKYEPIQLANDELEVVKNLGLKLYNDGGLKIVAEKTVGVFDTVVNMGTNLIDGLSGFLGLKGPKSRLKVSTDGDNAGSKQVNIDAESNTLTLGDIVNNIFNPKVEVDGDAGKAKVGKKQNDAWEVLLNETITYEDDQGVTHTEPGFVVCNDVNIPSIPSFKTKLAIVDTLIANTATIGQLNAANARIATLEADSITTHNLKTSIANITSGLVVNGGIVMSGVLQNSGSIYAPELYFGTADSPRSLKHGLLGGKVELVEGSTDTYHIVGYDWDGNEIAFSGTFRRAGGSSIGSSGWSNGTFTVKDTNNVVLVSTVLQALVPTGSVSKSGKSVSRSFDLKYGPDEDHLYSTGFNPRVSIDASSVYDAGWEAARALVKFPTTGTTASMDIKYPPSTIDGSAVTRTYTLSNDGDNAVKLTGGGYTVAKLTHNKYSAGVTAGKNAVGLTISASDAKIKRNQSSSALTEVAITLNTGSRGSDGNRTIQVKANSTVLLSTVINDYTPGYNAGYSAGVSQVFNNANFGYTSSPGSELASFIDCSVPGTSRHVFIRYQDSSGWHNKTSKTWYVPLPKLYYVNGPGSNNTNLNPGTYICVGYNRGGYDGGGDCKFSDYGQTYYVPSSSHSGTSVTTNSSWYVASSASEANAKSAAAYAMSCSEDKLTKITAFKNNRWVWFKASGCGGTKYYYAKIT